MMTFLRNLRADERGATAIEYGLIVALIAVAIITAVQGTGQQVSSSMSTAGNALSSANAAAS